MQKLKKTRRKHLKTTHLNKYKQKTEKLREKHKNINIGYPALEPTANKYLSGSGWEIFFPAFYVFLFSPSLLYMS